jgi:FXSXX-COOH protein
MGDNAAEHGTDLLDVSELSLRDLDELGDQQETPLGHALRRILDDSDSASVAGFTSFI